MDERGNEALTAQKADMLNKIFSKCFNRRSAPLETWSESDFDLPDEDTICELLTGLDVSKSSGADGISAKMLKYTAVGMHYPFCHTALQFVHHKWQSTQGLKIIVGCTVQPSKREKLFKTIFLG